MPSSSLNASHTQPKTQEVLLPITPEGPEVRRYKVKVKALFVHSNEVFRPGVVYRISPAIYGATVTKNGSLSEDTPFSELCSEATPEYVS